MSSAVRLGGLGLGLLLAQQAAAQTLVYQNFTSTSGLMVNGDAEMVRTDDGAVIRLAPAVGTQAGSVFTSNQVGIAGFSTAFQFRLSNPGGSSIDGSGELGADGFTFTLQTEGNFHVGATGQGLGYSGITPSLAVEFDTFFNGGDDPSLISGGTNHVGINTDGSVDSHATAPISTRLDNGGLWTAWIDYDGSTLEVRLSDSGLRPGSALLAHSINLTSLGELNSTTAFVGFTAGTGGAFANHDILNWAYSPNFVVGGITAVPEPGTYALLGLGGLLLLAARRFRRAR